MPAGVPAGITTSTEAVPASSLLLASAGGRSVVVTGKVPSVVLPSLTDTVVSRLSSGSVIDSEDRSNLTCVPHGVRRRGGGREQDPDGVLGVVHGQRSSSVRELGHVVDHACRSVLPVSCLLVPPARAVKLSPPEARNEFTVTE